MNVKTMSYVLTAIAILFIFSACSLDKISIGKGQSGDGALNNTIENDELEENNGDGGSDLGDELDDSGEGDVEDEGELQIGEGEGEEPAVEICDGLDNDGDGEIDEGLAEMSADIIFGLCANNKKSCVDGLWVDDLTNYIPQAEICDNLDNDCDGSIDEDLGTTTCGLGICTHTVQNCVGGTVQICDPFFGATEEVCDDLDNDCDGMVDGHDSDNDGIGAVCDNCPNDYNPAQLDRNEDGVGNLCETIINEQCAWGSDFADTLGNTTYSSVSTSGNIWGVVYFDGYYWLTDNSGNKLIKRKSSSSSVSWDTPKDNPTGIAYDGEFIWIATDSYNKIYKIEVPQEGDPDLTIVKTFNAPSSSPAGLAFDGKNLWISDDSQKKIYKLDSETGAVLDSFTPTFNITSDKSYAPDNYRGLTWYNDFLYSVDSSKRKIYQISPKTKKIVTFVVVQDASHYPRGITFWPSGSDVFLRVADYDSNKIYRTPVKVSDGCKYILSSPIDMNVSFDDKITNDGLLTEDVKLYIPVPTTSEDGSMEVINLTWEDDITETKYDQYGYEIAYFDRGSLNPDSYFQTSYNADARMWNVQYFVDENNVGTLDDIPAEVRNAYATFEDDDYDYTAGYGEADDSIIAAAVEEILDSIGHSENIFKRLAAIHEYVADHLYYKMEGGWDSAPVVLDRGYGSCSEYTFVFSAIARQMGIPTRYEGGTRNRNDGGGYTDTAFHRWMNAYIPNYGWVPFDSDLYDAYRGGDNEAEKYYNDFIGTKYPHQFIFIRSGGNSVSSSGQSNRMNWEYRGRYSAAPLLNTNDKWATWAVY